MGPHFLTLRVTLQVATGAYTPEAALSSHLQVVLEFYVRRGGVNAAEPAKRAATQPDSRNA